LSPKYEAIKDRDYIIVRKTVPKTNTKITIQSVENDEITYCNLHFEIFDKPNNFQVENNQQIALLDADIVEFPLVVRNFEKADFFYPLGMNQKKLLSDFFIDLKLNLFEKEDIQVLISGEDIIWIIDKRIDNRFKITNETKRILKITHIKK
jgi:tRNA(Ile)-lysidine synthase